jgi:hypothetical protein
MGQDVGVVASGFFKGVGQDGQTVEGTVIVNGLYLSDHNWGEPSRFDDDRTEWAAEDVTQHGGQFFAFDLGCLGCFLLVASVSHFRESLFVCVVLGEEDGTLHGSSSCRLSLTFDNSEFGTVCRPCSRNPSHRSKS